ncbi:putative capsular polysaccharide synthesis family protein [Flavobacteriaceae bacterium GSB9]|nr:putative capsular polysaccharide synthesis family protein [Flavobacteriaceae bacterium GSB9]
MKRIIFKRIKSVYRSIFYHQLKNKTIIIYTLGKVGSSTVYSRLKKYSKWNNIFHVHFLSDEWLHNRLKTTNHYKTNNIAAQKVFSHIEKHPDDKKYIISLVREPVSREISNFMQNPNDFVDGDILTHSIDDLKSAYLNKLNYDYTFNWFDTEFKEFTGFDVFARPFNKEKGYSIYEHNDLKILIIKLEKLNRCFNKAMKAFLGVNLKLTSNANQTSDKKISSVYKRLKEDIKFSELELKKVYSHKYVTHFYTETEIESFILKHLRK